MIWKLLFFWRRPVQRIEFADLRDHITSCEAGSDQIDTAQASEVARCVLAYYVKNPRGFSELAYRLSRSNA
jgi:hypothetical protein